MAGFGWHESIIIFFFISNIFFNLSKFNFGSSATFSAATSVTTIPDYFITSQIGAVSVVSASSPSRVTLAVERTLAIRC
jgi:hypothetical protein